MMRLKQTGFKVIMFICLMPYLLFSSEIRVVEENIEQKGVIDWTNLAIRAQGSGKPPQAEEDAKRDAILLLTDISGKIQISPDYTINQIHEAGNLISSKIRDLVQGSHLINQNYLTDGAVESLYEMDIKGGILQLVLPPDIKQVDPIKTISTKSNAQDKTDQKETPTGEEKDNETEEMEIIYTSFVFDTRGLNIKPVLIPLIINEKNDIVYGSAFISREFAVQQGTCRYVKDLKTAKAIGLTGEIPLLIKVITHTNNSLVISNKDAQNLTSEPEHLLLLKKCRVIIIVD